MKFLVTHPCKKFSKLPLIQKSPIAQPQQPFNVSDSFENVLDLLKYKTKEAEKFASAIIRKNIEASSVKLATEGRDLTLPLLSQ